MSETTLTITGNLTTDPELRYTQSGTPVTNLTIATTPRTYNKQTNQWQDGDTLFMRATIWREQAENAAETLTKGTHVIAQGRLTQRTYETRDGEKRTTIELQIDDIGPSLRRATAKLTRTQQPNTTTQNTTTDPWATTPTNPTPTTTDQPPF